MEPDEQCLACVHAPGPLCSSAVALAHSEAASVSPRSTAAHSFKKPTLWHIPYSKEQNTSCTAVAQGTIGLQGSNLGTVELFCVCGTQTLSIFSSKLAKLAPADTRLKRSTFQHT